MSATGPATGVAQESRERESLGARPTWSWLAPVLAFNALALAFVLVGGVLVPAHSTSTWADPEFTGWVAPIANRLAGSARLYEFGLHSPMPPLPYVLMHWMYPDGALWLDESRLNFFFQAATLLALFAALVRPLGVGIAFASVLGATPIFFALPKSIVYDSMAQFFTALSGIAAVRLVRRERTGGDGASWEGAAGVAWLALAQALLILTKQSTGAGCLVGTSMVLWSFPRSTPRRARIRAVLVALASTWSALVLVAVCLPYVNLRGMVQDLFVIGSEPKGGGKSLVGLLLLFAIETGALALALVVLARLLSTAVAWLRGSRAQPIGTSSSGTAAAPLTPLGTTTLVGVASAISVLGWMLADPASSVLPWWLAVVKGDLLAPSEVLLATSFVCCVIAALTAVLASVGRLGRLPFEPVLEHPLAPYAVAFLPAALFHNLSVQWLRWNYDNNPLVVVAVGFLVTACARGISARPLVRANVGAPTLAAVLLLFWSYLHRPPLPDAQPHLVAVRSCTEVWDEIPYLAGARMRPTASGTRALAAAVRGLARTNEDVLLLPGDPNLEAWFDRPHPAVSSAILFTDQYWDRYVEDDLARLEAHPPKVIVIGPSREWRHFAHWWHENYGVERLIDGLQKKLIPQRYGLVLKQPILRKTELDFMEVYVREDDAPAKRAQ